MAISRDRRRDRTHARTVSTKLITRALFVLLNARLIQEVPSSSPFVARPSTSVRLCQLFSLSSLVVALRRRRRRTPESDARRPKSEFSSLSFSWSSRRRFVSRNRINPRGHPPTSLGDARRTRRRVTPRASTARHRDETRLLMRYDAMRCVSRVEVEPQEACLSNLLRTSFADRARMISSSSSRARSGRGRDERHRNETKKKQKKLFFTLDITQGRIELVRAHRTRV